MPRNKTQAFSSFITAFSVASLSANSRQQRRRGGFGKPMTRSAALRRRRQVIALVGLVALLSLLAVPVAGAAALIVHLTADAVLVMFSSDAVAPPSGCGQALGERAQAVSRPARIRRRARAFAPRRQRLKTSVIHVFIGTKPEYVKIAPLLQRMDADGIPYRLIDSGQHAELAATFRREFGLRDPDCRLGRGRDASTIPEAVLWLVSLIVHFASRARLRRRVFGGDGGICVVHGDTPTTLMSALLAKRAGLAVAHCGGRPAHLSLAASLP